MLQQDEEIREGTLIWTCEEEMYGYLNKEVWEAGYSGYDYK